MKFDDVDDEDPGDMRSQTWLENLLEKWQKQSDDKKEHSREFRRTVYNVESWKKHRSSWRYWHHVTTLVGSRIITEVLKASLFIMAWSAAVCFYNLAQVSGQLPPCFPTAALPFQPVQFMSFALSLLLVFRTNASYGRWDEARRLMGIVVTTCRDLARMAATYFPPGSHIARGLVSKWLRMFATGLAVYTRGEELTAEMMTTVKGKRSPAMTAEEMQEIVKSGAPMLYIAQVLGEVIASVDIDSRFTSYMQRKVTDLGGVVGSCERLIRTPIPLSYTRHTCRFLLLWLLMLPLALWRDLGFWTIILAGFLSCMLLAIEEIGVQIEEPFGILPLERLRDVILGDVERILEVGGEGEKARGYVLQQYGGVRAHVNPIWLGVGFQTGGNNGMMGIDIGRG